MEGWHHSPDHRFGSSGAYMVTAGTHLKVHVFYDSVRLALLNNLLLKLAEKYAWPLQAWAVFSNHYHFVALSPVDPATLRTLIRHLHSESSREVNKLDGTPGRKVWHQFWDTQLTYERSYLARLHYVHTNAVHHRLVVNAVDYPYCSAAWFERNASATEQRKIASFARSADGVNVVDGFEDPRWDGAGAGQAPRS